MSMVHILGEKECAVLKFEMRRTAIDKELEAVSCDDHNCGKPMTSKY